MRQLPSQFNLTWQLMLGIILSLQFSKTAIAQNQHHFGSDQIEMGPYKVGFHSENDNAFNEKTLLRVGELILWSWKNFPEAEKALQFAAGLYPESARIYEMLGNLYWGMGNSKKAALNFEKSLRLNPANKRVQANLKSFQ